AAHLDEADVRDPGPSDGPVTVEVRSFEDGRGSAWYASLDIRRAGGSWRGTVAFRPRDGGRSHRTGEVFVEDDATAVRSRFLDFDAATLRAFLRSVLP
ncbi:MAG: hypothetical protein R3324_21470, partial [Halobacteriales archaeon]|nr:hypothetical protein [Halobacteriales archaeon]